jgi:hypothetical protein
MTGETVRRLERLKHHLRSITSLAKRSAAHVEPQIRIFSCGDEFPSPDALVTWLLVALRARGGDYRLRSGNAVAALAAGSFVLFRHGDVIVGEAVVREYTREAGTDRSLTGQQEAYGRGSLSPRTRSGCSPRRSRSPRCSVPSGHHRTTQSRGAITSLLSGSRTRGC